MVVWLVLYMLDAIRLCNRMIEILDLRDTAWPDDVIAEILSRQATSDTNEIRKIIGHLLDVRLVAQHTAVVARLVYAPFVAALIWFVARHAIFDNWSWVPQVSVPFVLSLLVILFSAMVLGNSAIRFKGRAVDAAERIMKSIPRKSNQRDEAEALVEEIQTSDGGAMVPLRKNPLIAATLVPLGSFSSLYLLELFLG